MKRGMLGGEKLVCHPILVEINGDTSLDEVYFALQLLESNRQLSLANRIEDWTSLGQYNWKPRL